MKKSKIIDLSDDDRDNNESIKIEKFCASSVKSIINFKQNKQSDKLMIDIHKNEHNINKAFQNDKEISSKSNLENGNEIKSSIKDISFNMNKSMNKDKIEFSDNNQVGVKIKATLDLVFRYLENVTNKSHNGELKQLITEEAYTSIVNEVQTFQSKVLTV